MPGPVGNRSPLAEALERAGKKTCRVCRLTKPLAAYPPVPATADGHSSDCRPCTTAQTRAWRAGVRARRTGTTYASPNALPVCGGCGHLGAGSYGVPDPVRAGDRLLWLCEPCYKANREALDAVTE